MLSVVQTNPYTVTRRLQMTTRAEFTAHLLPSWMSFMAKDGFQCELVVWNSEAHQIARKPLTGLQVFDNSLLHRCITTSLRKFHCGREIETPRGCSGGTGWTPVRSKVSPSRLKRRFTRSNTSDFVTAQTTKC